MVDAVYNPIRTRLIRDAERLGIPSEGGLAMLTAQAVAASALFRGAEEAALSEEEEALADRIRGELLAAKQNIVLIGMPASGKTTVGKILAKKLGRPLIDTDAEIVKRAGMPIPEIFAREGEAQFRRLEREMIASLADLNGAVIATGGGAVLDAGNIDSLKRNGRIYWLDRPLRALIPTADRPTASSREAIAKRYRERLPLYRERCDRRIRARRGAADTARRIMAAHLSTDR